ncbi:MAG: nucleoside triphosphate pyrophosphatase [Alcaligenaceae bacterium]
MPPSTVPLLYLASESPRRQELLHQIGIAHTVLRVPPVIGEDEPRQANESPLAYVQRTALEKAERAQQWLAQGKPEREQSTDGHINLPILAADTTVALGDTILGKALDAQHAASILSQLSGQTHTVFTAVVLAHQTGIYTGLSTSFVSFKQLSTEEIAQYIETKDCFGKAGAYGIQGFAARFIQDLKGSYSGVMGLPLYETAELLKASKLI